MSMPSSAEFVVIGGGAVGCAIAYALAKSGRSDVVVLERRPRMAMGTTSQGAGLCGQVRSTVDRVRLAMHSAQTFANLERSSVPVKPGWREVGSMRLALSEQRQQEFQQLAKICALAGLEVELIDVEAARRRWPKLSFHGVLTVLWCPSDGYLSPIDVVRTYEHYCRQYGVRFVVNAEVQQILYRDGRVSAVQTSDDTINCRYVINAAGPLAYDVARLAGLEYPLVPVRHQYFVSEPIVGLDASFPVLRVPDLGIYARVEGQSLLLGGFEANCVSCSQTDIAAGSMDRPTESDGEVLDAFRSRFCCQLPEIAHAGTSRVARGYPTFTPDGRFVVGECSQFPGLVMACGCNAHGISGSPGLGQALIESLFSEDKTPYVRSLSPDRFIHQPAWTWQSARHSVEQLYRQYYESTLTEDAILEESHDGF